MEEKNLGHLGFQITWLARKVTTEIQNRAQTDNQKPKMVSQGHRERKELETGSKSKGSTVKSQWENTNTEGNTKTVSRQPETNQNQANYSRSKLKIHRQRF